MTTASKGPSLPRWAKLIPPLVGREPRKLQESPDDDEKEEEEMQMRKSCFRILSNQMDQAMQDVLEDNLMPCVGTLEAYLEASSPIKGSESPNSDTGTSTPGGEPGGLPGLRSLCSGYTHG